MGSYGTVGSTELSKFMNYQFITNQKPKFLQRKKINKKDFK